MHVVLLLIKLILEACEAKMDSLRALLAVNDILLKVISGKTVIFILEQRLSLFSLAAELELGNIVLYTEASYSYFEIYRLRK